MFVIQLKINLYLFTHTSIQIYVQYIFIKCSFLEEGWGLDMEVWLEHLMGIMNIKLPV